MTGTAHREVNLYNSRLPIVVYAPKGYGVRYRFWNAGVIRKSEKGYRKKQILIT